MPRSVHSRLTAAKARALAKAAETLRGEADRLELRAHTLENLAEHEDRMAGIPDALREVRRWIEFGRSEVDALAIAADACQFRRDTLESHWREFLRLTRSGRKWRRDRTIMRLAWAGKTNAEIGAIVGMPRKSVSRVISQRLGRNPVYEPLPATNLRIEKPVHARLTPPRYVHAPQIGPSTPAPPPESS